MATGTDTTEPGRGGGIAFAMAEDVGGSTMEKIKIEQHTSNGLVWLAGWLFTIGYLHLQFWMAALAVVIWPYFIGVHIATLVAR
jgi:hypothetical protein